jgi:hypothetical protein
MTDERAGYLYCHIVAKAKNAGTPGFSAASPGESGRAREQDCHCPHDLVRRRMTIA